MEGVSERHKPELRGIMLNVFDFIFDQIQEDSSEREYLVYISYLEIYNEEIKDLLVKNSLKLALKETVDKAVYVRGLSKVHAPSQCCKKSWMMAAEHEQQLSLWWYRW
jgi:hypothetical protein